MTKAPGRKPDQIEVVEMDGKMWLQNGLTSDYVSVFLRSTPAREAAGELLEALEDAANMIEYLTGEPNNTKDMRAAIAKAKGEG